MVHNIDNNEMTDDLLLHININVELHCCTSNDSYSTSHLIVVDPS